MPKGVYQRTDAHRISIGKSSKGRHYKLSDITKAKMSASKKGTIFSMGHRKKLSDSKKGSKSRFWKGGIYKERRSSGYYGRQRKIRKFCGGGEHSLGEWEILKAQYNWTCPACGTKEPIIALTRDHVVPVCRGGSDNIENIQPLCQSCNSRKNTKTIKY